MDTRSQATENDYSLHSLGWKSFQNLCITIASDILGQSVQQYFDSNDGGRDGAFSGKWNPSEGLELSGNFTIQCKFTSLENQILKKSDLIDEVKKVKRLSAKGLADVYIIFTNSKLTGKNDEAIISYIESNTAVKKCLIFGKEKINQLIRETPRLRMLVPRVYGLGDLSTILDERARVQAQEILSSMGDDISKFVITDAYRKSAQALIDHGFVFLLGEPASGKSSIAAALSLGALDESKSYTIKAIDATDFKEHWNPNEKNQLFWIDDVFGATQLDLNMTTEWNRMFPHLNAAVKKGTKVIFTSRDYIYRNAQSFLKESAFPLIRDSQVIIHVENITKNEKEEILYNHIKLGSQTKEFRARIKPYLPFISEHKQFKPELARRLGNPSFTKSINFSENYFESFISNPESHLLEILETIDDESKAAISLVFMNSGELRSPLSLSSEEESAIKLIGGTVSGVRKALSSLKDSLVIDTLQNGSKYWKFKHPTIRDACASFVANDIELLDIYLAGTDTKRLMLEVTCGEVKKEGVKVVIPESRYEKVIEKISIYKQSRFFDSGIYYFFLSDRCDLSFLKLYSGTIIEDLNNFKVRSYLYAFPEVQFMAKMHSHKLLPEELRQKVLAEVSNLAISIPDSGFLDTKRRPLFSESEIQNIMNDVKEKLLPDLDNIVEDWKSNFSNDEDPEEYFDELRSALSTYQEYFESDEESYNIIDDVLHDISHIISDLGPYNDSSNFSLGYKKEEETKSNNRSIFEDVHL